MNKPNIFCLILLSIVLVVPAVSARDEAMQLSIFPQPLHVDTGTGVLRFNGDGRVYINRTLSSDPRAYEILIDFWQQVFGDAAPVSLWDGNESGRKGIQATKSPSVVVRLTSSFALDFKHSKETNANTNKEAYRIKISAQNIEIEVLTAHGLFNAVQTLLQLLPSEIRSDRFTCKTIECTLPEVLIEDYPYYQWRGFMVDTARHFRDTQFLRKVIDLMAMHKFNRFHLHFSDNEAYRLESVRYPKLNSVASRGDYSYWSTPESERGPLPPEQYYTRQEIRDLVAYAKKRFITIIPELDVPGHFSAVLRAYPEYRLSYIDENTGESTLSSETLDVHAPAAERLVKNLLSEVHEAFDKPEFFHLGGDEVNMHGFRLTPESQTQFLRSMENYLRNNMKTEAIIWNANRAAHTGGGLDSGIIQHWSYEKDHHEPEVYFNNKGLRHINSLAYHYYLDMQQKPDESAQTWALGLGTKWGLKNYPLSTNVYSDTEGEGVPYLLTAQNIYETENHFEALSRAGVPLAQLEENTIGVEAALWGEFVYSDESAWEKILPRLTVVAELAWREPRYKNAQRWLPWQDYLKGLKKYMYPRYSMLKVNYYEAPD